MPSKKAQELTAEEKRFIVQTLGQLELRGTADVLTQAIRLIDAITEKLTEEEEENT